MALRPIKARGYASSRAATWSEPTKGNPRFPRPGGIKPPKPSISYGRGLALRYVAMKNNKV